ncbi:MAG: Maf family protein [Lagierella massiliensis]|nr:Maf family protein [Lagierella massiliensis]
MIFNLDNIGTFIVEDHDSFDFKNFVLGSSSPRRIELVKEFIDDFKIIKPEVDERQIIKTYLNNHSTGNFLKDRFLLTSEIAKEKAKAVCKKVSNSLVLSADTVVITEDLLLGKPKNLMDAKNILTNLLGKYHYVCTGVCLMENSLSYKSFYVVSLVKFVEDSKLANDFIERYVSTKSPLDKAGSYNIAEVDKVLIDSLYGDYYNIVGLPLPELLRSLNL